MNVDPMTEAVAIYESARGHLEASLDEISNIDNPEDRLRFLSLMGKHYKNAGEWLSDLKTEAVKELHQSGYSYSQIAKLADVSKSRVQQLLGKVERVSKPGRLHFLYAVESSKLRGQGFSDEKIAEMLVPQIRDHQGGWSLTVEQISDIINCPDFLVRKYDNF